MTSQGLTLSLEKPKGPSRDTAWYNTQKGVDSSLTSLDGFYRLLQERHRAGYERKERLDPFLVLNGKFQLDECGNLNKRIDKTAFEVGSSIPTPDLRCGGCSLEWSIENIDDYVFRKGDQIVQLKDFVGKTLEDVRGVYRARTDAIYFMQPEMLVRADRFIDLSPRYPNPEQDWQKGIVKNERGWVGEREGIKSDFVIQEGDESFFNVWRAFHKSCNKLDLTRTYGEKFRQIFENAGFENPRLSAIPNQYCGCDHCAPWYNVSTEHGTITIGWRKRVINIDFSQTGLREFPKILAREDVTKGCGYIHAWGEEKAKEYLSAIRESVTKA